MFSFYYTNCETISDDTSLLNLSEDAYRQYLTQFLYSADGAKYRLLFRFSEEPSCTEPAPQMRVGIFTCAFNSGSVTVCGRASKAKLHR